MKKNSIVAYGYLALFAFVLGFSFTLAQQTQADPGDCCIYDWCEYTQEVGAWGHLVKGACTFTGRDSCDVAYICPEN